MNLITNFFSKHLKFYFMGILLVFGLTYQSLAMNQYNPQSTYGFPELKRNIPVKADFCISLGGNCTDKINTILKTSDQFVVSFMYRFNSPSLIRTLQEKRLNAIPVVVFLDYNQVKNKGKNEEDEEEDTKYQKYVRHLIENVPTSFINLDGKPFHHKVIISKKQGEEAIVILGSANATFEADNVHSEDSVIIQSNELAYDLLSKFDELTVMNQNTRKIISIDSHKVTTNEENRDLLKTFQSYLSQNDKKTILATGYDAKITALAVSDPRLHKNYMNNCLGVIVEHIFQAKNNLLLFFENFISSVEMAQHITRLPSSKLIVVDEDKNNIPFNNFFNPDQNNVTTSLAFRPFTGGKFHHKLIVQYPSDGQPIIYTGSFHFSENAIKQNSETLIGIQRKELAGDYIASILINSGLGEEQQVQNFINQQLGSYHPSVQLALKIFQTPKTILFNPFTSEWPNAN